MPPNVVSICMHVMRNNWNVFYDIFPPERMEIIAPHCNQYFINMLIVSAFVSLLAKFLEIATKRVFAQEIDKTQRRNTNPKKTTVAW